MAILVVVMTNSISNLSMLCCRAGRVDRFSADKFAMDCPKCSMVEYRKDGIVKGRQRYLCYPKLPNLWAL